MSINPFFKIGISKNKHPNSTPTTIKTSTANITHHKNSTSNNTNLNTNTSYDNHYDTTSSILSDYDDLELIDDESSYVLFNPIKNNSNSINTTNDILSMTNTTSQNIATDEENEEDEDVEDDDEEEEEEEDSSDDIKRYQNDNSNKQSMSKSKSFEKLSHKINNWHHFNFLNNNSLIDENVASWDLSETEQLQEKSASSSTSLEESKNILSQFYGDDLFKHLNNEEIEKVKNFHKLMNIKHYLLDENNQIENQNLLKQLIYKLLTSSRYSDNVTQQEYIHRHYNVGTTDYINYLSKDLPNYQRQQFHHDLCHLDSVSDTTNHSSLIMCGGVGFGGNASWNDI